VRLRHPSALDVHCERLGAPGTDCVRLSSHSELSDRTREYGVNSEYSDRSAEPLVPGRLDLKW